MVALGDWLAIPNQEGLAVFRWAGTPCTLTLTLHAKLRVFSHPYYFVFFAAWYMYDCFCWSKVSTKLTVFSCFPSVCYLQYTDLLKQERKKREIGSIALITIVLIDIIEFRVVLNPIPYIYVFNFPSNERFGRLRWALI